MEEGLVEEKAMDNVVGVVGGKVFVKIERTNCLQVHVYAFACVGQDGEMGLVGY